MGWLRMMTFTLADRIEDHVSVGSHFANWKLGPGIKMPEGYALMLDGDAVYFYWLRSDGMQSVCHWDKWAVYRGAKQDAERAR
jgi:hypothetical protein